MAVGRADIHFFRSTNGASAGGTMSATEIDDAVLHDLFAAISDAERIAGGSRRHKWFVNNQHGTDALNEPKFWVSAVPAGFTAPRLGLGFNDADDDTYLQGNMTAFGANAVVGLISSGADTRTAQIWGLNGSGVPISESVVLTGAVEVLSVATFSKVWAVKLSAESGSLTVTVRQGAGGTTRGTIGVNVEMCFLWVTANSEANAIQLPDLAAGGSYGFWEEQTWPAGVSGQIPTDSPLRVKEGA